MRKPFQGLLNIIRFNWHWYLIALSSIIVLIIVGCYYEQVTVYAYTIAFFTSLTLFSSLIISCYIYGFSDLYTFDWLKEYPVEDSQNILNIHAGFDETSGILHRKFPQATFYVFDFYNPILHTEVSIKRARKAYPPYPNTIPISTEKIPLENQSIDLAFIIFSAHEIRNNDERILFFKELNRIIKTSGRIIVTEHLRDYYNLVVYNVGAFHFLPKRTWLNTFQQANFYIESEIKTTPFITHFILRKHGATH